MAESLYNDVILDHIKDARNFRELADATQKTHGVNPLCGDTFTVYVRVEQDKLLEAAFQCECCGISMASASIMTDVVKGRTVAEVRAMSRQFESMLRNPADVPALPGPGELAVLELIRSFPSRINCALLGWHTLNAALDGRADTTLGA